MQCNKERIKIEMAERRDVQNASPLGGWPIDGDGKPMAMVSMAASELIGLPNFSNVTIGPAMIQRFCIDSPDERKAALKEAAIQVETVLAEEREIVQQALKGS